MFLDWHDYRMPLKEVPFRPLRFWIIIGLHAWILKCSFDEIIVSSILARKDRLWSKTWKFWKVLLFRDIIIYFFYIKESVVVMDRNHLIGGPEMMDRWNHFYEFGKTMHISASESWIRNCLRLSRNKRMFNAMPDLPLFQSMWAKPLQERSL